MADCARCGGKRRLMKMEAEMETAMDDEMTILEKFERLRSLRGWAHGKTFHDGDGHEERREKIDTLADDLEAWARQAEAGGTLNEVCGRWLGARPRILWVATEDGDSSIFSDDVRGVVERWLADMQERYPGSKYDNYRVEGVEIWRSYSEHDPAAAMELLEAMLVDLRRAKWGPYGSPVRWGWSVEFTCYNPSMGEGGEHIASMYGYELPLTIARACAVLAARGIKRGGEA